jgi:hypothetical protein
MTLMPLYSFLFPFSAHFSQAGRNPDESSTAYMLSLQLNIFTNTDSHHNTTTQYPSTKTLHTNPSSPTHHVRSELPHYIPPPLHLAPHPLQRRPLRPHGLSPPQPRLPKTQSLRPSRNSRPQNRTHLSRVHGRPHDDDGIWSVSRFTTPFLSLHLFPRIPR